MRYPCPRRLNDAGSEDAGYTLVELAVALAVTAVVASAGMFLIVSMSAGIERGQRQSDVVRSAHAALRQVAGELRSAGEVGLTPEGWTPVVDEQTIDYSTRDGRLLRNGSPLYGTAHSWTIASVEPLVVRDTLRAHRIELAFASRTRDGTIDPGFKLATIARVRGVTAWVDLPDR
jgi:prepilin-type N-terminal cleavage/methylation domain-containing protein